MYPNHEGALRLVPERSFESVQAQLFAALQHRDGCRTLQGKICEPLEHVLEKSADQESC
jgi:hypothetical protein